MHNDCSNNQAEQLAILKALEHLEQFNDIENASKIAAIYTDSRITIESVNNHRTHTELIHKIRQQLIYLRNSHWTVKIKWIKAHIGILGNEMADKLAKEATTMDEAQYAYTKIPKSTIVLKAKQDGHAKWQEQWTNTTKGRITNSFFPSIHKRMKLKIPISPEFTSLTTGHGKTRAYLHRFKIIDSAICQCRQEQQTVEHIIYECNILQTERKQLERQIILLGGQWPIRNHELIDKYMIPFMNFVKLIDFNKL